MEQWINFEYDISDYLISEAGIRDIRTAHADSFALGGGRDPSYLQGRGGKAKKIVAKKRFSMIRGAGEWGED